MKAFFVSQPYQWSIDLKGESWEQGSEIEGILEIKNLGSTISNLTSTSIKLCFGDIKKAHQRELSALKLKKEVRFELKALSPMAAQSYEFKIKIEENDPIMDKKSSFFLIYGEETKENHLLIPTKNKEIYTKLSQLLETFYRFKLKEIKNGKKNLEFKYTPPTSRDYAGIESLVLGFSFGEQTIDIEINADKKVLDTASVTTKLSKEEIKKTLHLHHKKLILGKGMIDQDYALKELKNVFDEIKMKDLF